MWIIQLPLHLGISLGSIYLYTEFLFFIFYFFFYRLTSQQKKEFIMLIFLLFFFFEIVVFGNLYFPLNLYDFVFYLINSKTIFEGLNLWYNDFICNYLYNIFDSDFIRLVLNCILKNLLYFIYCINVVLNYICDFIYINIILNIVIYSKFMYMKTFLMYYWIFFYNLFDMYFISLTLAGEHFGMVIICYLSDMTVEELYAKRAIDFMDMGILLSRFIFSWNWEIDAWSANIYDVVVIEMFHGYPIEGFYHLWVITQFYYFQIFLIFDLFGDLFKESYIFKYSINLGLVRYMFAGWLVFFHYFYTTYIIWIFYWIFFFWFEYYVKIYLIWLFIQYGCVDNFIYIYSTFVMFLTKIEIYFVCKILYMISDIGFLGFLKLHFLIYQKSFYAIKLFDSLDDWWYFWAYHWYGMIYMNWVYWVAGYYYDHDAFLYINRCNSHDFPCPYPCKNLPYGFFLHHFLMIIESFWVLIKYAISFVFIHKEWLMQIPFIYDRIYNFLFVDYFKIFFLYDYFYTFLLDCNIYLFPVPFITPLAEELLVSNINFYEYLLLIFYTICNFLYNIYIYIIYIYTLIRFLFFINLSFFWNYIIFYIIYLGGVIFNNLFYLCLSVIVFIFYYLFFFIKHKIDVFAFGKRVFSFVFFFIYVLVNEFCLFIINIVYFLIQFFVNFAESLSLFIKIIFIVRLQSLKAVLGYKVTYYIGKFNKNNLNNLVNKKTYALNYSASLAVYLYNLFINKLIYISIYLNKIYINKKFMNKFFRFKKWSKINMSLFIFLNKVLVVKLKINDYFTESIVNVITSEGYYFYKFELYLKILNFYFIKIYKVLMPTKFNVKGLLVNNFYYIEYMKIRTFLLKNKYTGKFKLSDDELTSLEMLTKYMHKELTFLFYLTFYKNFLYKFKNYKVYIKFLQKLLDQKEFKGLNLHLNPIYSRSEYQKLLKPQFFADEKMLYNVKKNPVINFLYKDFFFTKKDFLIFYNNTFFDFFSLILFKKSFSYDFFLKDIFHSTLLSFEEKKVNYLAAKKNVIESSHVFFNNSNSFLKKKSFLKNVNEDIETILSWLERLNKETKQFDAFGDSNFDLFLNHKGARVPYDIDRILYEVLYNNDNLVFEVLYNQSVKKIPLYSHVNSFFKKIQSPQLRFLKKNVLNEYNAIYNPKYTHEANGKLLLDAETIKPSDYSIPPFYSPIVDFFRLRITLETLSIKMKEHPEFSMFEDYFYLDEYNYVYVMYNNVWDLLYPRGELERDDDDYPLFSEQMIMFEYTYYLSVGLIEYTSCIFFYEYNLSCIIYHSLVYLYDIVLFYGYNDFNVFGSLGHLKKTHFSYFLENFYNETITLWDVYFFHLNENLSYNSTNKYLQNRFEMFKPDLPINHYKYTNDYTFPGYRGNYTKPIDPDTPREYPFYYRRRFVDPAPYKELSFLTAYLDLDFYVEYIDILEEILVQDQKLYYYSAVEPFTLNDVNCKLINPRFFTYLSSFLVSPLEQEFKWNDNYMLYGDDFFYKDFDKQQFYEIRDMDFETIYQNLDNRVITSEELPWHINFEFDDVFKDYSRMIDSHIYVASSKLPFDLLQQNMINVYTYMGTKYEYNFTVLDEFLFRFYFDYFFFSLKALTLNTVLVGEYQFYLPKFYVLGPIKEYTQDQTMILYDGLNVLKTSKLSKIDKIIMFYKKFRNFCLDLEYFESFKFSYSFFSFSGTYYYGFFFQYVLVCFVLVLDSIIYYLNFSMNLKHYEGFSYITKFIGSFSEFMSYAYYEVVLDYEPAEPIEKRLFRSYYPEPFFDMYIFKETDEYEGYSDDEHFVASTVFDSIGFNNYLLDVDNRYFSNNGEFSLLYHYADSLSAKLHMNLYFFRDFFCVLFIRIINYIFITFLLNPCLILKVFFNNFLLLVELCLFCFFVFLNFFLNYIKLFTYKFYQFWFFCVSVFLNKLTFIFLGLYFFNLIYIFFFEFTRYIFKYFLSCFLFKFFKFCKQIGFFKNIKSKEELFNLIFIELKNIGFSLVKLMKFLSLVCFKFIIIYVLVIFFFDHYDNIIYYLERYFDLRANYRSMFVLQSFLLFLGFLLVLYPLNIGFILWSFRYWFFIFVVFLWGISAFTNSTDFFTLPLWGVGTVYDVFKKEGIFYGPMFYEQFINKGKGGFIWVQTWRLFNVYDDWEHLEFDNLYERFVIDRFSFLNAYLHAIHDAIKSDTGINISETINRLKYYSSELKVFLVNLINTEILIPLYNVNWDILPKSFNYMFLSLPKNYREPLLIFFSSIFGDSQFDLIFRNYNLVFSQDVNFFSYNYQLFLSTFMGSSLLHYKFFVTSVLSIIPIFGYNYSYLYLYNFGFSKEKVIRYKYLYSVATLNSLKLNLWGEYKPTVSNFFMFYARNWKVLEDSFNVVPYQTGIDTRAARGRRGIGFFDEKKYFRKGRSHPRPGKLHYYKLDILTLMEEQLFSSTAWEYKQLDVLDLDEIPVYRMSGRLNRKKFVYEPVTSFSVNQFFTPPYNIEIDWQETNNRLLDNTNVNYDVNEPIQYPYNLYVNGKRQRKYIDRMAKFDFSPTGRTIHTSMHKDMPLNTDFLQYLVPDLGFFGSTHWGADFNYFLLDRETANEQMFTNQKVGPGLSRSKMTPKEFHR